MVPRHHTELTLLAATGHPVVRQAARELERCWEARGGRVVRVTRPSQHNGGPRVAVRLASLMCPTVLVRFALPYAGEQALESARLALTPVAWEGIPGGEAWRAVSVSLAGLPHRGSLDLSRPWVVTLGQPRRRAPDVAPDVQLHVMGGPAVVFNGSVRWPVTPKTVAAVLGRAAYVIGCRNPLCYDAARLGLPVCVPSGCAARDPERPELDLAGLVTAPLLADGRFWSHVAETAARVCAQREAPPPLLTPEWIALGRDNLRQRASIPPPVWRQVQRKYKKFKRDPDRFYADSPYAFVRALGGLRSRPPGGF
jgi:hypothetical protein